MASTELSEFPATKIWVLVFGGWRREDNIFSVYLNFLKAKEPGQNPHLGFKSINNELNLLQYEAAPLKFL
jgi:hypothetical protein